VCFVKLPILSAGCLRTGPGSHASRPAVRKPLPRRQMLGIGDVPGPAHIGDQVGAAEPPRCDFCMSRALTCEGAMTRCPICKSEAAEIHPPSFDGVGRPRTAPEVEQRIRDALATPARPGFHKIAAEFGVGTGTVQRIAAAVR